MSDPVPDVRWGLLATPGLEERPVKGLYFFPGEAGGNVDTYTSRPTDPDDWHWNTDAAARGRVLARIAHAHVNTVVMSYWSNMPQWSPMVLLPPAPLSPSLSYVLDAVAAWTKQPRPAGEGPLVIMPALEGGIDSGNPDIPHWLFSEEFPRPISAGGPAPGLVERIEQLITLFGERRHLWAQLYDRSGKPRYAVQIIHTYSSVPHTNAETFAAGFAEVADRIQQKHGIAVGFTLDLIDHNAATYVARPTDQGAGGHPLARQDSVLAVHGFASEVWSGKTAVGEPGKAPHDNNKDNLERMADWKRGAVRDWVATGLPMILDVTNGMDGRIIWSHADGKPQGVGFWGDNLDYTEDRWRNWMSQLKGPGIKGITMDTWNGYTEGWAATPSVQHGATVYDWLTDLLEPDPRQYSHMHYVGGARTHRVFGAICEKWIQLGADRTYGVPTGPEQPAGHGRVSSFSDGSAEGKAIYWSAATGAHEVHGVVAKTYWEDADGASGRLGLPVTDEEKHGEAYVSKFEFGQIEWREGWARGRITYT